MGETPAVDQGRAEWTHGSHGPHDAAVLEVYRRRFRHVTDLVAEYSVFSETRGW